MVVIAQQCFDHCHHLHSSINPAAMTFHPGGRQLWDCSNISVIAMGRKRGSNPSIKATLQVYRCACCSKYLSNVVIEVSIAHWAIVERFRRRDVQFSDHKQQSETIESGNSMANGSMASTQALSPQQQRPMTLVGPYGIELGSSNFHISSSSTPKQLEATISQTLQPPQPSL